MSNITTQASPMISPASETVLLAEFAALRDEILLRIGIRGKITALTITAFGAIVALSANEMVRGLVLFVYPVFALFMAHEWSCHDMRIFEIATYIRNRIEGRLNHDGWEKYLEELRDSPRHRMSTVAAWGMFMGSSILAPAIAAILLVSALDTIWEVVAVVAAVMLDGVAILLIDQVLQLRELKSSGSSPGAVVYSWIQSFIERRVSRENEPQTEPSQPVTP